MSRLRRLKWPRIKAASILFTESEKRKWLKLKDWLIIGIVIMRRWIINKTALKNSDFVIYITFFDIIFNFWFQYFATRVAIGSPQQREAISPYQINHPINLLGGRKPKYQEKTQDFRWLILFFMWGLGPSQVEKVLLRIEHSTLEVRAKWSNHFAVAKPCSGHKTM